MAGLHWGDLVFLAEPSCVAMIGTAAGVVLLSAIRALDHELSLSRMGIHQEEASIMLEGQHALLLPVLSSCALLAVFYLFASIQHIMLLLVCFSSVAAVIFVLHPAVAAVAGRGGAAARLLRAPVPFCGRCDTPLSQVLLVAAGLVVVLWWLMTGSLLLNNVLGVCFCISFISFVRLPNIKVCTVLLSGLFVYDVFWVFFSQHLFGANVMVAAATKQAQNPVVSAAEALHLPVPAGVSRQLDLPMKLLFPRSLLHPSAEDSLMLGLGDMALPGLLLALVLCVDFRRESKREAALAAAGAGGMCGAGGGGSTCEGGEAGLRLLLRWRFWQGGYTALCWAGYCTGLLLALTSGVLFRAAQPALLYLVPCTLLPVVARAAARAELEELWGGKRLAAGGGLDKKQEEPEEGV